MSKRNRERERERETVQTVAAAKRHSGYLMMKKLIAERKERVRWSKIDLKSCVCVFLFYFILI